MQILLCKFPLILTTTLKIGDFITSILQIKETFLWMGNCGARRMLFMDLQLQRLKIYQRP